MSSSDEGDGWSEDEREEDLEDEQYSGELQNTMMEEEVGVFDDGYASDMMGDEEDRKMISMMTDLEREQTLYERAKRREKLLDAYEARKKMFLDRNRVRTTKSDKQRRKEALESLSMKRKRRTEGGNRFAPAPSAVQKKVVTPKFFELEKVVIPMAFDKLRLLQMRKTRIEDWITKPFYLKMIGLYVRIQLGKASDKSSMKGQMIYSIGEIDDITESNSTYILSNDTVTKRVLVVKHLKGRKKLSVKYISNHSIEEKEYYKWIDALKRHDLQPPGEEEYTKKMDQIKHMKQYVFSQDEVNEMVEKNKRHGVIANIAVEKGRLKALLEDAEDRNDFEAYEKYSKQFKKLEGTLSKSTEGGNLSLTSAINKKNRMLNIERQQRVSSTSKERSYSNELDPFQRRHTSQSVIFFNDRNKQVGKTAENDPVIENSKAVAESKVPKESPVRERNIDETKMFQEVHQAETRDSSYSEMISEISSGAGMKAPDIGGSVAKAGTASRISDNDGKKRLSLSEYLKNRV